MPLATPDEVLRATTECGTFEDAAHHSTSTAAEASGLPPPEEATPAPRKPAPASPASGPPASPRAGPRGR